MQIVAYNPILLRYFSVILMSSISVRVFPSLFPQKSCFSLINTISISLFHSINRQIQAFRLIEP